MTEPQLDVHVNGNDQMNMWWLARLFVQPEYRSQGFGTRLVRRLQEELLLKPNFEKLVVEPGGYGSDPKRLDVFYKRFGFRDYEEGGLVWKKV
jgi:GNAT superfamily N-acetyltransferase